MSDWRILIQQMSRFGRLSESSKVVDDIVSAMTPAMKKAALHSMLKERVEGYIRANTHSKEVAAQLRDAKQQGEVYRQKLSEKHGINFRSLEEANEYDDKVVSDQLKKKKDEAEKRRQEIAQALMNDLQIEWSKSLLNSEFKLGNGTSITWGSATVAQHEARIRMMMANALGNVETMKRHEAAVMLLTSLGADCLDHVDTSPS